MELQAINESEFNQIEGIRQIILHDHSHRFARLNLGENLGYYGLSWRSQLVEPILEIDQKKNTIWIGVDGHLAAICQQTGRLLVAMPLTCYIVEILILEEVTVAITENEVLVFNPGGALRYNCGLPDIPEEISISGTNLLIKTLAGDKLTINPIVGNFKEKAMSV